MKKKSRIVLCGIMTLIMAFVMAMPVSVSAAVSDDDVAKIGDTGYSTLQQAIDSAVDGNEIVLLKNVTEEDVTFNKEGSYILNLNNHTLKANGDMSEIISIKTSNITLSIKDGYLISEGSTTYGIYAYSVDGSTGHSNLNLTLDNVNLKTIDQAVGVQGLNSDQNVTIKNSSIESGNTGIYFPPKNGILTIENSQVTGVNNGIVVKGGDVIISGEDTLIKATGTPEESDKPYDGNTSGEGFPKTGSAVYIEGNYSLDGQPRPININIIDGQFESDKGVSLAANYIQSQNTQLIDVQGGTFTSDVTQFVKNSETVIVEVSSKNITDMYYVGDANSVLEKINNVMSSSCSITVKQGNIAFSNLPVGASVKNEGTGNVTANGIEVNENEAITIEEQSPSQPTTTPGNEQETTETEAAGNSAKTGDDFNMTAVIALMGIAAATAAGTVVYGRRKPHPLPR